MNAFAGIVLLKSVKIGVKMEGSRNGRGGIGYSARLYEHTLTFTASLQCATTCDDTEV